MSVTIVSTATITPEPRVVAVERCMATIGRELGALSLYQSIAVQRALEDLADEIRSLSRCIHCDCDWC